MSKPFVFSWTCPQCKAEHTWSWQAHDTPRHRDVVHMECESCQAKTPMTWAYGKWTEVKQPGDVI